MAPEHTTAVFAAELILLLLVGRMLGEGMSRLGQPAIFGQLLAGVVLGPSVFGALVPEIRNVIFPDTPAPQEHDRRDLANRHPTAALAHGYGNEPRTC